MSSDAVATAGTPEASTTGMKIFGIVTVILGVLALFAPLWAGLAVFTMVGILVGVAGIARMIWSCKAGTFGKGAKAFLFGGLTLLAGVAIVMFPIIPSGFAAILLAVYFLADGALGIPAAFRLKPARGWGWMLLSCVISILLGGMIGFQFPLSGMWAVGVLFGVHLLFTGLVMVGLAPAASEAATQA